MIGGAERPRSFKIAIGAVAALAAVAIRYALPLSPTQLPVLTVVVVLAIVTTFIGTLAGITTAVVGGLLSWYFFFNPRSWDLYNQAWIPLLGFAVTATVIILVASRYRSSERLRYQGEVERLQTQAANAELFAREMAHRLKNALTIVQSIAFQTIGADNPDARKFAGRLTALANANELLSEHIQQPTALITEVIRAALSAFEGERTRFSVQSVDASISAQQVVSLTLAIHELATNATKYGALSVRTGSVAIAVADAGDRWCLTWKESGGPKVHQPEGEGFGTRLLRRSGMNTRLDFERDGVRCTIGIRKIG
jgi:two-component sensor histidine kinase